MLVRVQWLLKTGKNSILYRIILPPVNQCSTINGAMPKVSKPADLGPIPGGRCPCSRLCEIRITRGIDLYVYSADRAKTPLKIAETQRNVYKIDNPADGTGVVIWDEAGHK